MNISPEINAQQHQFWSLIQHQTLDLDCDCAIVGAETAPMPFLLPFPVLYALELTPHCNHQCVGCSNRFAWTQHPTSSYAHASPMPIARWEQILDTIQPHAQRLKITGGEPTTHPHFAALVAAIESRSIPFTLFTNACWSNPHDIIETLQQSSTCKGLLVSLHGADAHTHDSFTQQPGSFAMALKHIEQATAAGLTIYTNTVLTAANWHHVESLAQIAQDHGASYSIFNRYVGPAHPTYDVSPQQLHQVLAQLDMLMQAGTKVRYGMPIAHETTGTVTGSCTAGYAYCTIDPWGYVRPCNHAPYVAGNILESSLETIWNSATMRHWRALASPSAKQGGQKATCGSSGCPADDVLRARK